MKIRLKSDMCCCDPPAKSDTVFLMLEVEMVIISWVSMVVYVVNVLVSAFTKIP
jgi:hypothetical protein